MDKKMDSIHSKVQEQIDKMQSDFEEVSKENKELKENVDRLENKLDDLEGRSRRNNLIVHGIPHPQGQTETWADCEKAVKKAVREEMGIEDDVEEAKDAGKKAFLRFDTLIIEGKSFVYDPATNDLRERQRQS
ncbi:hypothetical protein ACOMHN_021603 [Nucella lapillus]